LGHYLTDVGKAKMPSGAVPERRGMPRVEDPPTTPSAVAKTLGEFNEERKEQLSRAYDSPLTQAAKGYAPPHSPPKRNDLQLYNIRSAIQEARSIHEKILETRGGPAVMVDARFAALIRAVDLLADKVCGVAK